MEVTGNKKTLYGYKKLIAWQKADELARLIYDLSENFPKHEIFGITSQLRRAGLSVVLNIVEGHARSNKKEFHRFLAISLGSLAETEYLLDFSYSRGLISEESYEKVCAIREETGHIIWRLFISQK